MSILIFGLCLGFTSGGAALAASDTQKSRLEISLAAVPKATWIAQGEGRRELMIAKTDTDNCRIAVEDSHQGDRAYVRAR